MPSHAEINLNIRVGQLESEVVELRHVLLTLCLQVQPPPGVGRNLADGVGWDAMFCQLGNMLETQSVEIGELAAMLMHGERVPTKQALMDALKTVRNRHQEQPELPPIQDGADEPRW